ncbi:MAG: hypothetical protein K9J37_10935 [Saprospiraceae bacterium]|nr:hypothetical protein [Saprospiraceae bacterium]MCF8250420.1 hypothetical protein [Saprospiraceae bacterium]MCF8280660.1 hypothetical protein [Bacteroidales bacterium]MCF8312205.1 hypothetical protein [Saprospiraceae bacterium]MCF8440546.1 hypothetical protein [Saprospiraceae bacterium]
MRNLLFVLLFLLPISLSAQLDDLLKNPDVSYVATFEVEHDFRLSTKRETSDLQLLKFYNPKNGCADFSTDNWLAQWMLKGMYDGIYKAYESADLSAIVTHSTLLNKISTIDTVITFYPETYEEVMQVVKNELNPADIKSFRTLQAIYYDKKSSSYQTRLLAIAPMVNMTDPLGKMLGTTPLAWLAMDGKLPNGFSAQNPDVAWAALLLDMGNPLTISKLKVKKNDSKKTFSEQLFQEAASMKHLVESSEGYNCTQILSSNDLEQMLTSIDTIIAFDIKTYEEKVQIVKNHLNPNEIKTICLAQEWYYDNLRKMLANRLKAVGPVVDVTDETGAFLYSKILYYLHF